MKIPNLIHQKIHPDIDVCVVAGQDFPQDLTPYSLVIHCGGCTLNEKEIAYRLRTAKGQGVPFCNYGIFIAAVNGIIDRSTKFLPEYK